MSVRMNVRGSRSEGHKGVLLSVSLVLRGLAVCDLIRGLGTLNPAAYVSRT